MEHDFGHVLKEVGLKVTPARMAILKAFSNDCHPVNAESLARTLSIERINLVTIYRALKSLEGAGIIRQIDLHQDSHHYELATHHHHHIVCTECGTIEGFEVCQIPQFAETVLKASKKFTRIQTHSLELFGLCNTCA
jgi:Fe2+ or Zn2+ uptake regulation protein